MVSEGDALSPDLLEQNQAATHGYAWLATYHEALRQMHNWGEQLSLHGRFGEMEALILQIAFGEYLNGAAYNGNADILAAEDVHDIGIDVPHDRVEHRIEKAG